jgi:hypothetical protein
MEGENIKKIYFKETEYQDVDLINAIEFKRQ